MINYDIVVLGAGESGVGAALLAKSRDFKVFVSDYGKISDRYKKELQDNDIPFEEGQHSQELILRAKEIIKSPGIPDSVAIIKAIKEHNISIISEIEFAGRYTKSKMIGITGSNGKTTTTMWLHHILSNTIYRNQEKKLGLAGNVGFSLARQVIKENHPECFVLELSSFQLDNMYDFHLDIAIVLNITPDHLDRYNNSFEEYALAKMRILQNQTEDDAFIYWGEDEFITRYVTVNSPLNMRVLPFFSYPQVGAAADLSDNNQLSVHFDKHKFEIPLTSLAIQGPHNFQNAMAASIAALRLGVSPEGLAMALNDFVNVPHRLEKIALIDGVRYINDSKATNINSTYYALRTMTTPYVLILGGKDKGNDYSEIAELIISKARALVFLTTDTEKLYRTFEGRVPEIVAVQSMKEAVEACHRLAKEGDTVLLSPACASFDLFSSYEDRGNQFRHRVLAMKEESK